MSLTGTAKRSLILLAITGLVACASWRLAIDYPDLRLLVLWTSLVVGLIIGLITIANKHLSRVTSMIFAACEGVLIGLISQMYNAQFEGIVLQAIGITFAVFTSMLLIYMLRIIKPTENFKMGVAVVTSAICLYYFVAFVLSFFGIQAPLIWDSGPWGIAFTLGVLLVGALNLIVDFDLLESGAKKRLPKYMEWYGAFALLVSTVWLYVEALRLLAKLRSR